MYSSFFTVKICFRECLFSINMAIRQKIASKLRRDRVGKFLWQKKKNSIWL